MSGRKWWRVAALVALAALLAVFTAPVIRSRLAERQGTPDSEVATLPSAEGAPGKGKGVGDQSSPAGASSAGATKAPRKPLAARPETPEEKERKAKVARAMDLSTIRGLLTTLKTSAVDDNAAIQSSTLQALKRYGATARPLIEDELAHAKDDRVRQSLEQALHGTK